MTDEERREMMRRNYAAQMAMLGYDASGNMLDKVLVVRCKDCKNRDPEDKKCDCGAMTVQGLFFPRPDNWFCADGERRENE